MSAADFDFILTLNQLIDESYRKIGVLPDGDHASSDQVATAKIKLNLILKEMEGDGITLVSYITDTLTTADGTVSYDKPTGAGLSYIEKVFRVDSSRDIPLERLDARAYADIEDKTAAGTPTHFFHNINEDKVYFWPVPVAADTMKLWGFRKMKDWDSANSTGELAARWQRYLKYALAVELGEDNSIPTRELQDLRVVADRAYLKARGKEMDLSQDSGFVEGAF
jgi:hypothetical protein